MGMFDGMQALENGLAASWLRNQTILNNIANNDTPNFKSSGVNFETLYKDALRVDDDFQFKKTRATHMDFGAQYPTNVQGVVVKRDATTYREDENNVDIDQETTDFAKNYIFYNSLLRKINSEFNQINAAVKGQ